MADLKNEAAELTNLLNGKMVRVVRRHRTTEILLEFNDGTRLFVKSAPDGLDVSVTGGEEMRFIADPPLTSAEPFKNVTGVYQAAVTYRCPCCGFKTLRGRGDEICQVCYWHDDGQDEHDADLVREGPNHGLSLRQGRTNFAEYRASDLQYVTKVRDPLPEEQ